MSRLIAAALTLLVAVLPTVAGTLSWDARALSYVHNMEFFQNGTDHEEGRTHFGQHVAVFGTARPAPDILVGVGVQLDVEFGRDHDDNWDATEPYLFLETDIGDGVLRFGNLDRRHQMLHYALIAPDLRYERPADRGLSLRRTGKRVDARGWIQWRTQERIDRREIFEVGGATRWLLANGNAGSLNLNAEVHLVHHGGQLSSVGRLQESWGLLVGPTWRSELGDGAWSTELGALVGGTADRRWRHDGRGAELRAAVGRDGFQAWAAQWWSEDWLTEDGRPMYRSGEILSWGAHFQWRPGNLIDADLGFGIHHMDGDNESEFWFLLDLASLNAD